MAPVAESHQLLKVIAGSNWLLDLTSVIDDLTGADAGAVLRPAVPGPAIEAIPTQHANTATVGRLLYGAKAKDLMGRTSGHFFALDPTHDCWYGGAYEMATDQITIPRGDLIARGVAFAQGAGAWYDGGPALTAATELDRVVTLNISADSSSIPSGLRIDTASDRAFLLLTTSAVGTIRLAANANRTSVINLAATTRLVDVGSLSALGSGRITNGSFEVTGITGEEKIEGWALIGTRQKID